VARRGTEPGSAPRRKVFKDATFSLRLVSVPVIGTDTAARGMILERDFKLRRGSGSLLTPYCAEDEVRPLANKRKATMRTKKVVEARMSEEEKIDWKSWFNWTIYMGRLKGHKSRG
jgi:hypothetical protein